MEFTWQKQIEAWLEFPLEFAGKICPGGLDFSMDSLDLADEFLGIFRDGKKKWTQEQLQQNLNLVVLGWGAYIGEVVRRTNPVWSWDFPDPASGELPQLVREGPGGLGRMVMQPINLALGRMQGEEEINVADVIRQQLDSIAQVEKMVAEHPEVLEGGRPC